MEQQTLILTALPHGRTGGRLRLSVHVAPRLRSDAPEGTLLSLAQFPDYLDWPARLAEAKFQVEFAGLPPIDVTLLPPKIAGGSALWQALFDAATPVLPYRFEHDDLSGAVFNVMPISALADALQGIYRDVGITSGTLLPAVTVLANDPKISGIARPTGSAPGYPPPTPQTVPVEVVSPPPAGGGAPSKRGCCCWLGWFFLIPLLRALRARRRQRFFLLLLLAWLLAKLCKRFCGEEVETGTLPPVPTGTPGIPQPAPEPGVPPPQIPPPAPFTPPVPSADAPAFQQLEELLKPFPTQPLPTAAKKYDFHEMISLLGDYPVLLPTLGLVLEFEVPFDPAMAAAGTVRVLATWAPPLANATLHQPLTRYTLDAERFLAQPRPIAPEQSNGFLRLNDPAAFRVIQVDAIGGGTKMANAATNIVVQNREPAPPNMRDHAGLPALRTNGIALVQPNLAESLQISALRQRELNNVVVALEAGLPLPPVELFAEDLTVGYRVDVFDDRSKKWHSLCQRKGTYEFTGGPLTKQVTDEGCIQIGGTEPVGVSKSLELRGTESLFTWEGWSLCAPRPGNVLLEPSAPQQAGQPDDVAPSNFLLQARFVVPDGTLPRLRFGWQYQLRVRSVDLAGHSVFSPGDAAFSKAVPEVTPTFFFMRYEPVSPPAVVLRNIPKEGESLEHLVVRSVPLSPAVPIVPTERHLVPPKISMIMAEQHEKLDGATRMRDDPAGYRLAAREAGSLTERLVGSTLQPLAGIVEIKEPPDGSPDAGKQHTWVLQTKAQFELAYLPDVLATSTLLRLQPGGAEERIAFDGVWPDLRPFRIRLSGVIGAAPGPAKWNPVDRVLNVEIAPAQKITVLFNSQLPVAAQAHMGVWQWISEPAPANLATLQSDLDAGRNWLQMPYRQLLLTHAVQQPLEIPAFAALTTAKTGVGSTVVTLAGTLNLDSASTGKVDVSAAWSDPFDDPAKATFDPLTDVVSKTAQVGEVLVPEDAGAAFALPSVAPAELTQNLGDTKYHRVTYSPVATTRFREFFPPGTPDLTRPGAGEAAIPLTVEVLNSARPEAPRILYVIPTFRWTKTPPVPAGSGEKVRHTREGNGLRVYLERPWFSSGWDERLGVIIRDNSTFASLPESTLPLITQWGRDPVWLSPAPDEAPHSLNFAGFVAAEQADGDLFQLDEQPGQFVAVLPYAVEFDETRGLWFADIEMKLGDSYNPFVRLALARYQPHSIDRAELSRVVRADFVQLLPDREASVTFLPSPQPTTIEVKLNGTVPASAPKILANVVELALEIRRDNLIGDLAWQPLEPLDYTVTEGSALAPGIAYSAEVKLKKQAAGTARLVIREYERYWTGDPMDVPNPPPERVEKRLVYADTFEF